MPSIIYIQLPLNEYFGDILKSLPTQQSLLVVPFPFGALETSVPDINEWQISGSPVIIKCSLAQALDMSGKIKGIVSVKQSKMISGFIGL